MARMKFKFAIGQRVTSIYTGVGVVINAQRIYGRGIEYQIETREGKIFLLNQTSLKAVA